MFCLHHPETNLCSRAPKNILNQKHWYHVSHSSRAFWKHTCVSVVGDSHPEYLEFSNPFKLRPDRFRGVEGVACAVCFVAMMWCPTLRLTRSSRVVVGPALHRFGRITSVRSRSVTVGADNHKVLTERVVAPNLDEKSYRVLELRNGLRVLLASDTEADSAAAAMTIRCGCFQDPASIPGLAHFHEHMLFLGTEKYPQEDEYSAFLNDHGGFSNAFTSNEFTTYHFKVAATHLLGALDRFAQFFLHPTFAPSALEREMQAVDSESTNYSMEEQWRMMQVLKTTVQTGHPFHRFDVGNLSTLGDPLQTREEIIKWNFKHYQAGAMKLVVMGNDSLDDLQRAVERFAEVRQGTGKRTVHESLPWLPQDLGFRIMVEPIKEARSVTVHWPLPGQGHLLSKPEFYLAHVLGHEGEGSLHDELSSRGWVDSLTAGVSQSFADAQLFTITINLTPEGDAQRDGVLDLLFAYTALARRAGPQKAIFQEIKALHEIKFAHTEDAIQPDDFAVTASNSMHFYEPELVLRGPVTVEEWQPEVIASYLDLLTPSKSLVFEVSPSFGPRADAEDWTQEPWYRARYSRRKMDERSLARWGKNGKLRLPAPNLFVPQDFSLRCDGLPLGSRLPTEASAPSAVVLEDVGDDLRLWHKLDTAFRSPRAALLATVRSDAYADGPDVVMMLRLFCGALMDDLNTFSYDALVTGLSYNLEFSDKLNLSLGGFSDKLLDLLEVVTARMVDFLKDAEATEADPNSARSLEVFERIEVQRQLLLQDYANLAKEEPHSVSSYYLSQLTLRGTWHISEYVATLGDAVCPAHMARAVKHGLSRAQLEVLVHGNTTEREARAAGEMLRSVVKRLGSFGVPMDLASREVTRLLPQSTVIFDYDLGAENPAQENSCTHNVYQVGLLGDPSRDACLHFLCHVASVSCFQALRTEQQLGYIVQAGPWVASNVAGLQVLIQGNRAPPCTVDDRVEAWLAEFRDELAQMSPQKFTRNVAAVTAQLTERWRQVMQEMLHHWSEIDSRRYVFNRAQLLVQALSTLQQREVLETFDRYVAAGASERRKLSVQIRGTGDKEPVSSAAASIVLSSLSDIRQLHASLEPFRDVSVCTCATSADVV